MRAVRSHKPEGFEGIESLVYEDAPDPRPAIGDALVRVRAASFTPTELTWPLRTDRAGHERGPIIPAHEGSGVVVALGYGTAGVSVGDETVVIHGAGSGVGAVGVQLARWAGAHVIGTGRASARPRALEFGADEFVDLEQDGWEKAAGQVDLVYDAIGGDVLARSPAMVKPGGAVVTVMAPLQTDRNDIRVVHFVRDANGTQLREITRLVDEGIVRPQVGAVYPLAEAREAFMAKSTQHIPGKVVLTP